MHGLCIVVGEKPEQLLEPFACYSEVVPYKSYLDSSDIQSMAEHYSLSPHDLPALAAKLPDWSKAQGGVEDGRLFFWSTANPKGKFDYYKVGGRYEGYFKLRNPRPPSGWGRILGKGGSDSASQAHKKDVDIQAVLSNTPAALLWKEEWHECPVTDDATLLSAWEKDFATIFESIPSDALLTAVDWHL